MSASSFVFVPIPAPTYTYTSTLVTHAIPVGTVLMVQAAPAPPPRLVFSSPPSPQLCVQMRISEATPSSPQCHRHLCSSPSHIERLKRGLKRLLQRLLGKHHAD